MAITSSIDIWVPIPNTISQHRNSHWKWSITIMQEMLSKESIHFVMVTDRSCDYWKWCSGSNWICYCSQDSI